MKSENSWWVVVVWIVCVTTVRSKQCNRISVCKCEMDDGTGVIDLNGISTPTDGTPRWQLYGNDGWNYQYNPCVGFNDPYSTYTNLAVLQTDLYYSSYDLGIQTSESFNYTDSTGVIINYVAADLARKSRVNLICNKNLQIHSLEFIGELITTEYDFVLEGPCACPGGCDENGVLAPPTQAPAPCNDNSELSWNVVGFDLVSLIIHDLILVFVIGGILAVLVYVCGYQFGGAKEVAKGFTSNVYSEA